MINLIDRKIKKQLQKNEKFRRISLIEYFKMNRLAKKAKKREDVCFYNHKNINKNSRDYLYQDISKHFTWKKIKKTWTIRKKSRFVNKIYFISLKIDEIFYFRLLLINRKNVTFFDDLRTMNVQMKSVDVDVIESRVLNYQQTCVHLDLTHNDDEWHDIMKKITIFDTKSMLRNLLTTILLECNSAKSRKLWDAHKVA